MAQTVITITYLIASVCFILGIKMMGSPKTAVKGNIMGSVGMLLAIVATLFHQDIIDFNLILAGIVVGSALGAILATRIEMTAMPQMVALLNGFGGIASAAVATAELWFQHKAGTTMGPIVSVPIVLSILIGQVTFTGSLIAFGKLQGLLSGQPITYRGQKIVTSLIALIILGCSVSLVNMPAMGSAFWGLQILALVIGILLVIPIGGADMPVVIALLNSYSGLAACATGFVLDNSALIISGSLVGASGIILTMLMCKAMNRSLANVLFGAFGKVDKNATHATAEQKPYRQAGAEDVAMILASCGSVVFVPGYGMAVAQAQHAVKELAEELEKQGLDVRYAIHPVAGRMPGHMNVLLAEANIPYEQLYDLDDIQSSFPQTDAVLVIGANDTVNPAARSDQSSPIYGMPILDVDKARTVFVLKRSMNPGFAGIDNELFFFENTMMVFGDAKKTVLEITHELKELA